MKVIGYTTGVFDLFHIGHLNLLKRAKAECDYLVVGVTTDELPYSRKAKYPVVPFAERMAIVEHIKCVDTAVAQAPMDKLAAWEDLQFKKMMVRGAGAGRESWTGQGEECSALWAE